MSVKRLIAPLAALGIMWMVAATPPPADAQQWQARDTELRIGVLDEPPPAARVFGSIVDVAVDGEGHIYVLDDEYHDLRVFDSTGSYVTRWGREGRGPGEFQTPRRVAVDSEGRVYVLDFGNARISRFVLSEGSLVLEHELPLSFAPEDVCILDGRVFVKVNAPLTDGGLIREVGPDGRVLRAFAERLSPEGELPEALAVGRVFRHNSGPLHCHDDGTVVILAHTDAGVVRAFSMAGAELWSIRLADWRQQGYELHPDGGCCQYNIPDPASGTFHYVSALGSWDQEKLVVGMAEATGFVPGERSARRLEARVLRLDDGTEVHRFRSPMDTRPIATLMELMPDRAYGRMREGAPGVVVIAYPNVRPDASFRTSTLLAPASTPEHSATARSR